jgi:predicted phosphodiesterase
VETRRRGGERLRDSRITAETIRRITASLSRSPLRPKDREGRPGGLVELEAGAKPIIVGDLHACLENLKLILAHEDNDRKILRGECLLILLGDSVHNDQTGQLREMASSLATLEHIFRLFQRYHGRLVHVRGNHDSFDERLVKNGIAQGLEFRRHVVQERGEPYAAAVAEFFEALPLFVIGKGFVIAHAGPIRGGAEREELIDIRFNPDEYQQLLWNRINEFGGTTTIKEYDHSDIRASLQKLGLAAKTHFIVGHNPLWSNGERSGLWRNVLGIENHHILYSGHGTRAPYLTFQRGRLQVHFASPEVKEPRYV